MSLTACTFLGAYQILGPLGEGGMGELYPARDTELKLLFFAPAGDALL